MIKTGRVGSIGRYGGWHQLASAVLGISGRVHHELPEGKAIRRSAEGARLPGRKRLAPDLGTLNESVLE